MPKFSKIAIFLSLAAAAAGVTSSYAASGRTWAVGEKRVAELLHLMDQDKNGQVSKDEFMAFMSAEFDRLDRDRSGTLTPDELSRLPYATGGAHANPHR